MRIYYSFCCLFVFSMLAFANMARAADSALGSISVNITNKVKIISLQPLNFGHITPVSGKSGKIVVSPTNIRLAQGNVGYRSGLHHPAMFRISGTPGGSYVINVPDSLFFTRSSDSGVVSDSSSKITRLKVNKFVIYRAASGKSGASGKLGADGQDTIYLGGTLNVPENAAAGVYSGIIPLTIAY